MVFHLGPATAQLVDVGVSPYETDTAESGPNRNVERGICGGSYLKSAAVAVECFFGGRKSFPSGSLRINHEWAVTLFAYRSVRPSPKSLAPRLPGRSVAETETIRNGSFRSTSRWVDVPRSIVSIVN